MKAKRTATVARPSLEEARAIFEVRRCLEREAIRLLVERWRPELGAALEGHVRDEEEAAKRQDKALSIRLAGEFHIRLAEMTGNELLLRYVSEVVSRCSLILAVFGRPHSSECGIHEHHGVIAALRSGDVARAVEVMDHHVALVESRALIAEDGEAPDLGAIIGRYLPAADTTDVVPLPSRRRAGKAAS
jgi:DNA-binding GntR family transcriptional regulator